MAAGNKIGATANVRQLIGLNPFAPVYGALVLELKAEESALNADSRSYDSSWLTSEVRNMLAPADYDVIGVTHEAQKIEITDLGLSIDLEEALKIWQAPLEEVFPVNPPKKENTADLNIPVYTERSTKAPAIQIARPKVIIPVFPGTNCEVDSRRAFERAGADVKVQIINNMSKEALQESAHELAKNIRESQIVMIPGGFSGGDEPDGSAKFIVALFRNEEITEAVHEHLNNKDGLMLGICNGFQALIKLGLVPYGKIVDAVDTNPTLTYNDIGRHQSSLIKTKIVSVKSPWMALCEPGDIHTVAISHGEGKFIADPKLAAELIANGQVATQYCDHNGNPSMDVAFNPNGSYLAIEGITSPDGRVLGKMGHSERIGQFVHKNVAGEKDQKIFEAGVRYFR